MKEAPRSILAHRHMLCVAVSALLLIPPRAVAAQGLEPLSPVWRPHQVTLTVLGGGAAFSDFLTVDVADDLDERLTARTSLAVGAALAYWPSRSWGVRLQGSWTPTRFERERPGTRNEPVGAHDSGAPLSVWTADADLLIHLPLGMGRVEPYGLVGGGIVRYATEGGENLPPEARVDFASGARTRAALVVGAGALIPLQRRGLLLTFEVTDHVVRSPVEGPEQRAGGITSNVRLLVGLTLPLVWSTPTADAAALSPGGGERTPP